MLFLSIRHLSARKQQTFLILCGILLGTTAYVVISGMMLGFQSFLTDQLVNNDAQVRISAREEFITPENTRDAFFGDGEGVRWLSPPSGRRDNLHIEHVQGWIDRLEADPRIFAYSPQLTSQVIFRRAKVSRTGRMIGCDPTKQSQVTTISHYVTEGNFQDIGQSGNRLIAGEGLLKLLGARVGETVLVSVGSGIPTPFKIIGRFRLGVQTLDDTTAYAALSDVQKINRSPSEVSDIALKLLNVSEARQVALDYAATTTEKVQSWDQANENILSVFKTQDIVRNSMTIAILIVAGFGIYNILSILVNQKKREIAILRSMGFEPSDISKLFFSQGLILGALGGVLGLLVGYCLCRYIETIPVAPGRLGSSGTMIMSYEITIYVKAFLLAFLSASFASWLPARAAARLTPIQIIRSESA